AHSRANASGRHGHCRHLSAEASLKIFLKRCDYGLLGDARSKAAIRLLRSSISLPLFIAVTIPQIATPPSASTPMTANKAPVSMFIPLVLPAGGGPCGVGAGGGAGDGVGLGIGMGALEASCTK